MKAISPLLSEMIKISKSLIKLRNDDTEFEEAIDDGFKENQFNIGNQYQQNQNFDPLNNSGKKSLTSNSSFDEDEDDEEWCENENIQEDLVLLYDSPLMKNDGILFLRDVL